ncbi:MAG TPA: hypothetical protein VLT36_17570, partial [Candidatus Dormibacteraeota bacterium]|nr:hypothetical protein [Candidatus Dormibacteraeota bacterium]
MASLPLDDLALTPSPVLASSAVIPNGLVSVAVNSALNKVYLSGGAGGPPQMVEVDGDSLSQLGIGSGSGADVDRTNNTYWAAEIYSGSVNEWSSNDTLVTSITLNDCPVAVSVDAPHRKVWVANQCGGGNDPVWVINAD